MDRCSLAGEGSRCNARPNAKLNLPRLSPSPMRQWLRRNRLLTLWPLVLAVILVLIPASRIGAAAMRPGRVTSLRRETVDLFYHGFDNYMRVAFPEDEVWETLCVSQ